MIGNTALTLDALSVLPSVFASITPKNLFDIFFVALIIYFAFIFVKQTKSFFMFYTIVAVSTFYYVSLLFNLSLTRQLFQYFITFILVFFVVVFQGEIRRFFKWLVSGKGIYFAKDAPPVSFQSVHVLCDTIDFLAKNRIGAIFVFPGEQPLDDLVRGGVVLDGRISRELILSIFDTSSPGHDGAIILTKNRIRRFGVHLPLAEDFNDFTKVGTRHRAAAGITEETDALAIVVSEERGAISIAENGSLRSINGKEELEHTLLGYLNENFDENVSRSFWYYFFVKNFWTKVFSVLIASFLWFFLVFQVGTVSKEYTIPVEFRQLPNTYIPSQTSLSVTVSGSNRDISLFEPTQI